MKDKTKPKEIQLSQEELSELGFVAQQRVAAHEVATFWEERVGSIQRKIEKTKAIDEGKHIVDWSRAFSDGKIYLIPKPTAVAEVQPVKEEEHGTDKASV